MKLFALKYLNAIKWKCPGVRSFSHLLNNNNYNYHNNDNTNNNVGYDDDDDDDDDEENREKRVGGMRHEHCWN